MNNLIHIIYKLNTLLSILSKDIIEQIIYKIIIEKEYKYMEKEIKINHEAPVAIGPYSPALKIGNQIFVSGQLPMDPQTGEIISGDIEKQTEQSLQNLRAVLKPYSVDLNKIVKVTIFLKDMNDFPKVNNIYGSHFKNKFPARSCVEVSRLPKNALIEIEAIAYCDNK